MTVIVKHNKTNTITDWTQAQLDEQIALGNFPPGTTLANIVLPSDWNNDHTLTGLGTMAEQNANSVAITGGTINNTTIGATTATTGKFTSVTTPSVTATTNDLTLSAISTGAVNLATASGTQVKIFNSGDGARTLNLYGGNAGGTLVPTLLSTVGSMQIAASSSASIRFQTNATSNTDGIEQARVSHTASAVNYVQVTGATTTNAPVISGQGSDTDVGVNIRMKGAAGLRVQNASALDLFRVTGNSGTVANYLRANASLAASAPSISSDGSDTNISLAIQPKGTGAINLAAGSSGVNISNGGTVTAITRTAGGSGYTGLITAAISAPTTAGGVQATVAIGTGAITQAIVSGGTGYTVGNILNVSGGTVINSSVQQIRVDAVSGGVITGISVAGFGQYTTLPTNPVSVTGGSGSGATFNLSNFSFVGSSITNAGSGYIEQPTITFSGGGGSGAAAYATVGSNTTLRSIGSNINFNTPSGTGFGVSDAGATSAQWWQAIGGAFTGILRSTGSTQNGLIQTSGTGGLFLQTNNGAQTQFVVSHTASAVNYVQVTGAATTGSVVISSQGSDTNVGLQLRSKGTGDINLMTAGGTNQVVVRNVASAVNYLSLKGSAAGNMVPIQVEGTDTNIDLALTPKGTGLVRFGTYVAGALLATGYINIKAADGTTYKVLVST
jgi:hypothetical protein